MKDPQIEHRYVELRVVPTSRSISGTIVRYGDRADISGAFAEEIEPRALKPAPDLILNMQHDRGKPIVRLGQGLEIGDDDTSMFFRAVFPETIIANTAMELVEHRLLKGVSVEMRVKRDEWRNNTSLRIIKDADLVGLALVDKPAYPQSSVSLRSSNHKLNIVKSQYWY